MPLTASGALVGAQDVESEVPLDEPIIVTIDGPAGTGKSTVARMLAKRLGLDFLDTGAMYRAATAIYLDSKLGREETGELLSTVICASFGWKPSAS